MLPKNCHKEGKAEILQGNVAHLMRLDNETLAVVEEQITRAARLHREVLKSSAGFC